jgi:hypothetical protein
VVSGSDFNPETGLIELGRIRQLTGCHYTDGENGIDAFLIHGRVGSPSRRRPRRRRETPGRHEPVIEERAATDR